MWSISFLFHNEREVKLAFSLYANEKWILYIQYNKHTAEWTALRCSFGWIKMTWNIVQFFGIMVWRNLIFLFAVEESERREWIKFPMHSRYFMSKCMKHFSFTHNSQKRYFEKLSRKSYFETIFLQQPLYQHSHHHQGFLSDKNFLLLLTSII